MDKFIEEIKKLSRGNGSPRKKNDAELENDKALKILYDTSRSGIEAFNTNSSYDIKIHKIPSDLIPLFFNFQYNCGAFVIKTDKKYIFIIQGEENKIFIYGLSSQDGFSVRQSMTRAVQLLNLDFKEDNEGITFFDSTKKRIDPEEVILQLIRWGLD